MFPCAPAVEVAEDAEASVARSAANVCEKRVVDDALVIQAIPPA